MGRQPNGPSKSQGLIRLLLGLTNPSTGNQFCCMLLYCFVLSSLESTCDLSCLFNGFFLPLQNLFVLPSIICCQGHHYRHQNYPMSQLKLAILNGVVSSHAMDLQGLSSLPASVDCEVHPNRNFVWFKILKLQGRYLADSIFVGLFFSKKENPILRGKKPTTILWEM